MKSKNTTVGVDVQDIDSRRENLEWKRLLVPLDFTKGSVKALNYAIPLARRTGGKLVLLHIVQFPVMPTPAVAVGAIGEVRAAHKALTQQAKMRLDALAKAAGTPNLIAHKLVTTGFAADEIVKTAKRLKCDLVVISTYDHTGIKRILSSHTAEHVVRTATCPVLCVPG